ncbi:MAG: hypothetical protein COU22_03660 [Candidatus Komeilibacteria bacterium CG10_big_fil_rev_8_21_14_0_10_41_13]|uniref:Uncharacterized protein n=1 Tax=Candidatus Komeilibacteria bacterium CG10_big_fil_rev_8_21_14_0_10_41_13 TaxID=1974476 RepID=A0A2M6WBL6_9BACT|nr:MAG: hypothetical protein COU22_03660 [Candidatus Komeilibacteria bacterium CG10_big_fil_rev_8_21_14_0_10_41_13]
MNMIKWTPMLDPFDEMDKFFSGLSVRQGAFAPTMDIYQDKDNVIAEVPLAGVKPEDVKITIENDVLTIEGSTEAKTEVDDKEYYRKEIRSGSFFRSLVLPASVNGDKAEAEYDNGMLKITVPKKEEAKPKSIKVAIKKK